MKIKSELRLKAEDVVDAMYDLLDAIREFLSALLLHPPVERALKPALMVYWGIGGIGLAWMVIAGATFFLSGFKSAEGSVVDWLRDFTVACPWLALIWLFIIVTTCWMLLYKEKHRNQVETKIR